MCHLIINMNELQILMYIKLIKYITKHSCQLLIDERQKKSQKHSLSFKIQKINVTYSWSSFNRHILKLQYFKTQLVGMLWGWTGYNVFCVGGWRHWLGHRRGWVGLLLLLLSEIRSTWLYSPPLLMLWVAGVGII